MDNYGKNVFYLFLTIVLAFALGQKDAMLFNSLYDAALHWSWYSMGCGQ